MTLSSTHTVKPPRRDRFTGYSDCVACGGNGPCASCEDTKAEQDFLNSDAGQAFEYRREMFDALELPDSTLDAMLDEMFLANDPIECADADDLIGGA